MEDSVERIVIVPGKGLAAEALNEWPTYRKTTPVHAKQYDVPFEVDTLEGQSLHGKPGDYLVGPGAKGEFWPVDREVFETTHVRNDEVRGFGGDEGSGASDQDQESPQ